MGRDESIEVRLDIDATEERRGKDDFVYNHHRDPEGSFDQQVKRDLVVDQKRDSVVTGDERIDSHGVVTKEVLTMQIVEKASDEVDKDEDTLVQNDVVNILVVNLVYLNCSFYDCTIVYTMVFNGLVTPSNVDNKRSVVCDENKLVKDG